MKKYFYKYENIYVLNYSNLSTLYKLNGQHVCDFGLKIKRF